MERVIGTEAFLIALLLLCPVDLWTLLHDLLPFSNGGTNTVMLRMLFNIIISCAESSPIAEDVEKTPRTRTAAVVQRPYLVTYGCGFNSKYRLNNIHWNPIIHWTILTYRFLSSSSYVSFNVNMVLVWNADRSMCVNTFIGQWRRTSRSSVGVVLLLPSCSDAAFLYVVRSFAIDTMRKLSWTLISIRFFSIAIPASMSSNRVGVCCNASNSFEERGLPKTTNQNKLQLSKRPTVLCTQVIGKNRVGLNRKKVGNKNVFILRFHYCTKIKTKKCQQRSSNFLT